MLTLESKIKLEKIYAVRLKIKSLIIKMNFNFLRPNVTLATSCLRI